MQDRNAQSALSTMTRQLSAPQVSSRSASTESQRAQMEYSSTLLGQLSNFGAQISEKEMQDTARAQTAEARIKVQQGKTLKEIHESDDAASLQVFGETATMMGAEAELARISASEFKASEQQALRDGKYANMTPSEYRAAIVARYAEGLESMPEGGTGREMLAELGGQAIIDLSANHMQAHYEHKQKLQLAATTKSMYGILDDIGTAKEAGDKVALKQLHRDLPGRLAKPYGMSDDNYAAMLAGVTVQALGEGNDEVYDVVKELNPSFTPDQRRAIEDASRANDVRVAQRGSIESATFMANISTAAANGASPHQVSLMIAEYNSKYPLAPLSEGQMASYLTQTATVQANRVAEQQAKNARTSSVINGEGVVSDKEGSAALADIRTSQGGLSDGYLTVWAKSPYEDKQLKQELGNSLNIGAAVTADGAVNPQFQAGYDAYQRIAQHNETKARSMLSTEQLAMVDAIEVVKKNGGDPVAAVRQMQEAKENPSAIAPPSKNDIAAEVKDEDFGTGSWTDWGPLNYLPGTDDEVDQQVLDGARAQYTNDVHKMTAAGIPVEFAKNTAAKNQTARLHRVDGMLVDTHGTDLGKFGLSADQGSPAAQVKQGLTIIETELRTNEQLATVALGAGKRDDWDITGASVVPGTKGRPAEFVVTVESDDGDVRALRFDEATMKRLMPKYTPAAIEQRTRDARAAADADFRKRSEAERAAGFKYHSASPK